MAVVTGVLAVELSETVTEGLKVGSRRVLLEYYHTSRLCRALGSLIISFYGHARIVLVRRSHMNTLFCLSASRYRDIVGGQKIRESTVPTSMCVQANFGRCLTC